MNQVNLIGRLTKDIELRQTPIGNMVCNFTLAVNRRKAKEDATTPDADFVPCVAWNKTAEVLSTYTSKGSQIGVEGKIQTRSYDDPNIPNKKVYITEVLVSSIYLLDSKKKEEQYQPANTYESYEPVVTSDDLPF
jgi:single-strand DNA-binding protein